MDGLNEMMDFMDAFTLSSNAQEGTKDLGGGRFLMFFFQVLGGRKVC
jgi:hypothetical protein